MSTELLIVAGEASADHHAAKIVRALGALETPISCFGMGGDKMCAAGLDAVAHANELSVMGFFEVVRALPRILAVEGRLKRAIRERRPTVAVLIDLPDFNLRLARFLKSLGVYVIYYISPQVWAWRSGRVKQIKAVTDEMLCVLPFEEPFYRERHVAARFVGHPLVEDLGVRPSGGELLAALGLGEAPVIGLLPGSRRQESARLLPPLLAAAAQVAQKHPEVRFVLPLAGTTSRALVERCLARYPAVRERLSLVDGRAQEVLALSRGAAVASGTATLEAALVGTPFVALYKMSWLSFFIAVRLIKVASVILANLILGQNRVRELLQGGANPDAIAGYLLRYLEAPAVAAAEAEEIRASLLERLGRGNATANVVLAVRARIGAALPAGRELAAEKGPS